MSNQQGDQNWSGLQFERFFPAHENTVVEENNSEVKKRYDITKPQGVQGRNSDNKKLREVLKWEPQVSLEEGLGITYKWICEQLEKNGRIGNKG